MTARRAALLAIALVAVAVAAYFALREPPPRRIAILGMDTQMQATRVAAFRDEMKKRGFEEGRNLVVDYVSAEGRFDRLPALAQEIVSRKPEVIVTAAPPSVRAAQQATSTIPVVMSVHDPVGMGFVNSLARPGRNMTGIAFQDWELSTKRLDQMRGVVPGLARIAILWNEAGGGRRTLDEVVRAATALGIESKEFEVRAPSDIAPAVAAARQWGAQAMIQLASPVITRNRRLLIDALAEHRMPASCELKLYVEEGCLMTYSADLDQMFRGMAGMTVQILNGAKPQDMPMEQPREFDFVINMETARELGLAIPPLVLLETTGRVEKTVRR